MKAGDCCSKLGRNDEACRYYDRLVNIFSTEGFVVKAIAVHKLILKINPRFPGGENRLSVLYDKKVAEKRRGPCRPRVSRREPAPATTSRRSFRTFPRTSSWR